MMTVSLVMHAFIWIAIGGALGSVARHGVSVAFIERVAHGAAAVWATLAVNVSGSLLIGFVATLGHPQGSLLQHSPARLFLTVGLCGGYTTFSAFSLQTLELIRAENWLLAGGNILLSVFGTLLAVFIGHKLALFFQHA